VSPDVERHTKFLYVLRNTLMQEIPTRRES
jgi:hypothetical protein